MFQITRQKSSERKASETGPRPSPQVPMGNQAMLRRLQAKLTVSQPGDPDELEADRVADPEMMPELSSAGGNSFRSQRKCESVLGSSGQPLDPATRAFFERGFGQNFSRVRLHTSMEAQQSALAIQANAYSVGTDIVFGPGQYAPESRQGKILLAHELAHVVQQRQSITDPTFIEPANSPAEREATTTAVSVLRGDSLSHLNNTPRGIARDVGWAARGPIPDLYGMGYNTIFNKVPASLKNAVWDLLSLEQTDMKANVNAFAALPGYRAVDVLSLEPFAVGTGCEAWFSDLRSASISTAPFALTDPYAAAPSAFPIMAHFFKGTTDRRALIIGGVHNKTEPQGADVVQKLRAILETRPKPPFFSVVLVPNLFDPAQYSKGSPRWVQGGAGTTDSGKFESSRPVEPNRNFPLPGEDLEAAHNRGASSPKSPELVFSDPASTAPRAPQDTAGGAGGGTSTRMLPETRALIALIESFHPERIASVHAHSLKNDPGDAPGIFVDPRPGAAQAAEDDRLATAMVKEAQSRLSTSPIPQPQTDPFKGNAAGTAAATVHYATGAPHAEGNSLGMWAPVPVASGSGARPGITTMTIEVPQWKGKSAPANLDKIEDLDAQLLSEIFLEDPTKASPATGTQTP